MKGVIASTLLGSPEFIAEVSETHVCSIQPDRSVPAIKKLSSRPVVDRIVETVKGAIGEEYGLWKKVSIYFCHRHGAEG